MESPVRSESSAHAALLIWALSTMIRAVCILPTCSPDAPLVTWLASLMRHAWSLASPRNRVENSGTMFTLYCADGQQSGQSAIPATNASGQSKKLAICFATSNLQADCTCKLSRNARCSHPGMPDVIADSSAQRQSFGRRSCPRGSIRKRLDTTCISRNMVQTLFSGVDACRVSSAGTTLSTARATSVAGRTPRRDASAQVSGDP